MVIYNIDNDQIIITDYAEKRLNKAPLKRIFVSANLCLCLSTEEEQK